MSSVLLALLVCMLPSYKPVYPSASFAPDTRCYELRTYTAAPGKLDDLLARFRNHTVKLFEKHGITNVGYWLPVDNKDNKLIYMVSFPSREARDAAFKEFGADPEWQKAYKESEANGKLLDKAPESLLLAATDYSPEIKKPGTKPAAEERSFELRIYKAAPGKLADLNARFRDHTVGLFTKHGMVNFGYWTPVDKAQGAEDTLVYLLIHKSKEAAGQSWRAFVSDPEWTAARDASEKNGKLLERAPESIYLKPTDFSPVR
jgi:hypothetical protein